MPLPDSYVKMMAENHLQQQEFEATYMTTTDIMEELGVSRAAVFYARERGQLPPPIRLKGCQVFVWKRTAISEALAKWAQSLNSKRV